MAFVGLKYAVFAPIENEVRGQALTYGKGVVIGRAIGADISFSRNSNPLYADDARIEDDNSITGGTVSINVDDVSDEAQTVILGTSVNTEDDTQVYSEDGDASPYGGFGYIRVRRLKGVTSYVAYFIHKVMLGIATETANTKGESITWQTPTLSGSMMAVVNREDMKNYFRDHVTFETEAEAVAWLNKRANITDAAGV